MGNEFKEHTSHSAEYFGDTRDYWWNQDFLELMARRWRLDEVREALDVGCGVGHWGRLVGGLLPEGARILGIDRDPFWIEKARERAAALPGGDRFRYQVATAEELPFEDDRFDLVTCQTVLIHARDPGAMLAEMIRVTRPGGLVAVAEPNNISNALILSSTNFHDPADQICALIRFQLVCERGKEALGEGNNSVGELLPGLFAARGLLDVQVYANDKTAALVPPYASPQERATVEEITDFTWRGFWIWSREETGRYFLAGGGAEGEFDVLWATAMAAMQRIVAAISAVTHSTAGGAVSYLVSGRKRALG